MRAPLSQMFARVWRFAKRSGDRLRTRPDIRQARQDGKRQDGKRQDWSEKVFPYDDKDGEEAEGVNKVLQGACRLCLIRLFGLPPWRTSLACLYHA